MSKGEYTIDDLRNRTGEIKEELRSEISKVAKQRGELYEKYDEVCAEEGVDPVSKLVDQVFMVLLDKSYADTVQTTEMGLGDIRNVEAREEDMEYVLDLYEEYDLGGDDEGLGIDIESLVEERIRAMAGGPLGGVEGDSGGSKGDRSIEKHLSKLNEKLDRMERRLDAVEDSETAETDRTSDDREVDKELDDIFSEGGDENAEVVEVDEEVSEETDPLSTTGQEIDEQEQSN